MVLDRRLPLAVGRANPRRARPAGIFSLAVAAAARTSIFSGRLTDRPAAGASAALPSVFGFVHSYVSRLQFQEDLAGIETNRLGVGVELDAVKGSLSGLKTSPPAAFDRRGRQLLVVEGRLARAVSRRRPR